jgi:hypothetical protein
MYPSRKPSGLVSAAAIKLGKCYANLSVVNQVVEGSDSLLHRSQSVWPVSIDNVDVVELKTLQ